MIPNSSKLNRGNHSTAELMEACKNNEISDLIIVNEHRGVPGTSSLYFVSNALILLQDGMLICHLPYGPTAYFGILNCVMRHDILYHSLLSI